MGHDQERTSKKSWATLVRAKSGTNITRYTYNSEHEEWLLLTPEIAKEELSISKWSGQILSIAREIGNRAEKTIIHRTKFWKKHGSRNDAFIDRLLFSKMTEARSCEFKVLSQKKHWLRTRNFTAFTRNYLISGHYTTFFYASPENI
jgi:tRNA-(ms[2]io[6]A)-hydroxylase